MSNVILHLDKYQFYPGHTIRGRAVCQFRSSKEVRKVRIRLKGEENTSWLGTESYYDSTEEKDKTRTVTYYGSRDILVLGQIVHGEGTMGVGEHVFPFEFTLPEDLPSSFTHQYGSIRFSVKLTVDRPWKTDYESKRNITILPAIRLQTLSPNFQKPMEMSDEKTICCLCCASGPIQLNVNLEKRAFVVGETVGIRVYCMNMSNVNVESVTAQIKQKLRFEATYPSYDYKYDSELITISHKSGVGAHGEKTFNLSMPIPPSTVVPNFTGCRLFASHIELKVEADISGMHTGLGITTNIVIGHVPYNQPFQASAQFQQSALPYRGNDIVPVPVPVPMPMHMPMPMPMRDYDAGNETGGAPPYPVRDYPPGPSAPQEFGAPSAPSKLKLSKDTAESGAGNSSAYDPPPPTYYEAAKNFN